MKKFLSYVFTFLLLFVISAATTVSVSYFNGRGTLIKPIVNVGGDNSSTSLFTGILNSFTDNKQFNFEGEITLESEEKSLPILLYVNVDIEDEKNIKVEGFVSLNLNGAKTAIEFAFYNNTIYLSYNNLSVKITTKTIYDLIDEISNLIKSESLENEGQIGESNEATEGSESFIDELMPKLMQSLNDMTETELENGDKKVNLEIEGLANVEAITTSENAPKNVKVQTASFNGYSLSANINIDFNDNIVILNPETIAGGKEYFDAGSLYNVILNTAKLRNISALASVSILDGGKESKVDFTLLANILDNNYRLSIIDNNLGIPNNSYLTYFENNLYLNSANVNLLVSKELITSASDIVLSLLSKVEVLNGGGYNDVESVFSNLAKNISFENLASYLSIVNDVSLSGEGLVLKLDGTKLNLGENIVIRLGFNQIINEIEISGLVIDGVKISATVNLDATDEKVSISGEYLDLYEVYNKNIALLSSNELDLDFNLNITGGALKGNSFNGNLKFSLDKNFIQLSGELSGKQDISLFVLLEGETGFVKINNIKIKASKSQISNLLENLGFEDILSTKNEDVKSQISEKIKLLTEGKTISDYLDMIEAFDVNSSEISLALNGEPLGVLARLKLKLNLENYVLNSLEVQNLKFNDSEINFGVSIISKSATKTEINEDEYLDVINLIENIISLKDLREGSLYLNAIVNRGNEVYNAYLELIGSLDKKFMSLNFSLSGSANMNLGVNYVNETSYVNIQDIYLSVKNSTVRELLSFFVGDNLNNLQASMGEYLDKVTSEFSSIKEILTAVKALEINSSCIKVTIDGGLVGFYGDLFVVIGLKGNKLESIEIDNLKLSSGESVNLKAVLSTLAVNAPSVNKDKYLEIEKLAESVQDILGSSSLEATANIDILNSEFTKEYELCLNLAKMMQGGELNFDALATLNYNDFQLSAKLNYLRNTLLLDVNGLKVKLEKDSILRSVHQVLAMLNKDENSLDGVLNTIISILESGNLQSLVAGYIDSALNKISAKNLSQTFKNLNLFEILNLLSNIKVDSSGAKINIDGLNLEIVFESSSIKEINLTNLKVSDNYINANIKFETNNVTLEGVSKEEEENYINLAELVKVANATANSLKHNSISGNFILKFNYAGEVNIVNVSYGVRIENGSLAGYIQTSFKGISVNIYYLNGTFYLDIAGLKIHVEFSKLEDVITYLNEKFNLEIDVDLNAANNILTKTKEFDVLSLLTTLANSKLDFIQKVVFNENSMEAILYNGLTIFVGYNAEVEQVIFNYNGIMVELNLTSFDEVNLDIKESEYSHYTVLTNMLDNILNTIQDKQFNLSANVDVFKNGKQTYNITAGLALDLIATEFNTNININNFENAFDVNVAFIDKVLYFDYSNLKLKINQQNLKELLVIVLNALGVDAKAVGFLSSVAETMDVSTESISNLIPSIDLGNPLNMLEFVKGISLNNNVLSLVIDGSLINENAKEAMVLNIVSGESGIEKIELNNIYTGSGDESFNLELTKETFEEVGKVSNPENYIDISNSSNLVKSIINTTSYSDYTISGQVSIGINLISLINFNLDVDLKANIKVVDGKPEMYIVMDIPVIGSNVPGVTWINVNNDVPYVRGDTSVDSRKLEIMFKDEYIYIHRTDVVRRTIFASRTYEKKLKVHYQDFLNDIMYYLLEYSFGFSDAIMGEIETALEKTFNRDTPLDYSNILLGYQMLTENSHNIVLNLAELANNDQLDTATINILTRNDLGDGKEYLDKLLFNILMPVASGVEISIKTDNLALVDVGKEIDLSSTYSYINSYEYGANQEYENGGDGWTQTSEYTIYFNDSMGNDVSEIKAPVGSSISLPTLQTKVVDNGATKITYSFAGWYTSSDFNENSLFTLATMPRGDTELYAKWEEKVENYQTISFNSMGGQEIASITALAGESITLLAPANKIVIEGQTKITYGFAGWYTNEACTNEFKSSVMPNESITLYAKWEEIDRYVAYLLTIKDNGETVFEEYVGEGSSISLSSLAINTKVDNYTKLYKDSGYYEEYSLNTMPSQDVTLYIRNRYALTIISEYGNKFNNVEYHYQGEAVSIPLQSSYVEDDGITRTSYSFMGWENMASVMPNSNLAITATWNVDIKHYYTITFHLDWYTPLGWASKGTITQSASSVATNNQLVVLEGDDVSLSSYVSTLKARYTRFSSVKTFKSTSWSTTKPGALGTNVNKISEITSIDRNYDLYAVWEVQ